MDAYEKLIKTIRNEGNRSRDLYPIKLATMTAAKTCTIGTLELDEDDLLVSEHLVGKLKKGDSVILARVSSDKFVIIEKVVDI